MDVVLQDIVDSSTNNYAKPKKNRQEKSALLIDFAAAARRLGERKASKSVGIARSTLYEWRSQKNSIALPDQIIDFFECPIGIEFLNGLIATMLFVMIQVGGCGIRTVCLFLKLSKLSYFVASSYGAIQAMVKQMELDIVDFGVEERKELSKTMPPKKITICNDETFHPSPCLVSIEPVSNFILVEEYSEKRDAESWSEAMKQGLEGLPVDVIQVTSDEGKGVVKYIEKELGVHH